jgi:hypothetical protein
MGNLLLGQLDRWTFDRLQPKFRTIRVNTQIIIRLQDYDTDEFSRDGDTKARAPNGLASEEAMFA